MKHTISEILFEEIPAHNGKLGIITLNRQKALNALNHVMFIALDEQLEAWKIRDDIKAVVIQAAEGRAFSAGGDIRYAYERKMANDPTLSNFFRDEYQMNSCIHHYPKPYIALLDGITMGGGVGVSIHGSHRIGTQRLVFSMPETGIGFYPDVGTTYYLSRMPHKIGFYLGLTGARISYVDCFALGVVQEIIAQDSVANIIPALAEATTALDKDSVSTLLKKFAIAVPSSELLTHHQEIENCFDKKTVEEIVEALENYPSQWCKDTAAIIKTKSPTSLKVTLHALQKAQNEDFDACMKMEYNLTCHFVHGHDFFEGVRAAIIDKDQKPQWKPATLTGVTEEGVEKYFVPVKQVIKSGG